MTIKHAETVERYTQHHAEIAAALENLQEFFGSMPAPDENNHLPLHYGQTGDVARIRELLAQASQIADEMYK